MAGLQYRKAGSKSYAHRAGGGLVLLWWLLWLLLLLLLRVCCSRRIHLAVVCI